MTAASNDPGVSRVKSSAAAVRFASWAGVNLLTLVAFAQLGSAAPASEPLDARARAAFRPDEVILKLSADRARSMDLADDRLALRSKPPRRARSVRNGASRSGPPE